MLCFNSLCSYELFGNLHKFVQTTEVCICNLTVPKVGTFNKYFFVYFTVYSHFNTIILKYYFYTQASKKNVCNLIID